MAEDRAQERTEQATPHRRREARRRGQVARSPEVNSVAMLGAGLLVLLAAMPSLLQGAGELVATFLRAAGDGAGLEARLGDAGRTALLAFARILGPVVAGTVAMALASNVAQVGFLAAPSVLEPSFDKINPVEGFKRIFGKRALFELVKGLLKLGLVAVVAWATYRGRVGDLIDLMFAPPGAMVPGAMRVAAAFALRALVALAVVAAFDYAWQRWEFEKSIRMSLQDIREELKEHEGDPQLKSRMKSIQQKLASQRMMEAVKDAALVITNPTHYAVALGYDEGHDPAPRVVARGVDEVARRIREIAREHGVPIVEKPALARMLYRECEVGQTIPATLFEAVAQVLAWVYALRRRRGRR